MATEQQADRNLHIVAITEAAGREIARALAEDGREGIGVRLGVKGGGCSGLSYVLDFDTPREKDYVDTQHGFKVFIDAKSGLYLKGVALDFEGGLGNRGFKWINPNASNTCGCGESFSI